MKKLVFEVSLDEANQVVGALATQPYGQVAGLISKLQQQANKQLQEERQADVTIETKTAAE